MTYEKAFAQLEEKIKEAQESLKLFEEAKKHIDKHAIPVKEKLKSLNSLKNKLQREYNNEAIKLKRNETKNKKG